MDIHDRLIVGPSPLRGRAATDASSGGDGLYLRRSSHREGCQSPRMCPMLGVMCSPSRAEVCQFSECDLAASRMSETPPLFFYFLRNNKIIKRIGGLFWPPLLAHRLPLSRRTTTKYGGSYADRIVILNSKHGRVDLSQAPAHPLRSMSALHPLGTYLETMLFLAARSALSLLNPRRCFVDRQGTLGPLF
jgi:hypothetical protein